MEPIIVYEPAPRMEKIIQHLRSNFKDINPLPSDRGKRYKELRRIPKDNPAIYLWGSGFNHGESFFFDTKDVNLKINFDAHTDTESRTSRLYHLYLSHIYHSAKRHNLNILIFCNKHFHRFSNGRLILLNGEKLDFVQNIAYTIDLDIVNDFPAERLWTNDSELTLPQLIKTLNSAKNIFGGKLMRLDIGGLRETPEHTLTDKEWEFAIECYTSVLEKGYEIMTK
ncbi:hypothetical protein KO317_03800 [Candidatus Micrarchaeota archaeon]|jgi:hypothetical protein|nr:hypothetical protein [Candidatus Micrarchaeota archaeon]